MESIHGQGREPYQYHIRSAIIRREIMTQQKKSLGEKLRKLRESYNLSQNQVAEALNIDRSTYSYYELDKTRPNLETLVKLSHIFSVSKSYLLPDDPGADLNIKDMARSDSMLQGLSKEERGLIILYRSLNREDQEALRKEMANLAKNQS